MEDLSVTVNDRIGSKSPSEVGALDARYQYIPDMPPKLRNVRF